MPPAPISAEEPQTPAADLPEMPPPSSQQSTLGEEANEYSQSVRTLLGSGEAQRQKTAVLSNQYVNFVHSCIWPLPPATKQNLRLSNYQTDQV